jgi:N-acetylglucosamine-6-phosphate deacetylase
MALALTGCRIFDGEKFLEDHAVVLDGAKILAVVRREDVKPSLRQRELAGGFLAPGFIDVQVNGGGGALLNANPSVANVNTIAQSHRRFGTTGLMPTVITDSNEVLSAALAAVRLARKNNPAILGIHVEGPFLDVTRKGAHDPHFIRAIAEPDVAELVNADCGRVMLTVAPNKVSPHFIGELATSGILVSLGHAEASFAEAQAALAAGARAFTHLFNAMSQLTGREPGMVGAALSHADSYIGIIADGFHVHDAALRLALAAKNHDRFMLITDAMSTAAGGPPQFELQGRMVSVSDGRLQLEDGTLAGSNLTMDEAVRYAIQKLGVDFSHALRMASLNPARFLKLDHELGRIAPGYRASLVHLDQKLNVLETWVDGA